MTTEILVIAFAFLAGFMLGCHIGVKAGLLHATKIIDEEFGKRK